MNCGGIPTIYRTRQVGLLPAPYRRLFRVLWIPEHGVIVVHRVVVVPDGFEIIAREHIGVEHPSERLRNEASASILALLFRRYSQRAEYGPAVFCLVPLIFLTARGNAPVDVPVPVRNAQWYPLIEVFFRGALRRSVHRTDEDEL